MPGTKEDVEGLPGAGKPDKMMLPGVIAKRHCCSRVQLVNSCYACAHGTAVCLRHSRASSAADGVQDRPAGRGCVRKCRALQSGVKRWSKNDHFCL